MMEALMRSLICVGRGRWRGDVGECGRRRGCGRGEGEEEGGEVKDG